MLQRRLANPVGGEAMEAIPAKVAEFVARVKAMMEGIQAQYNSAKLPGVTNLFFPTDGRPRGMLAEIAERYLTTGAGSAARSPYPCYCMDPETVDREFAPYKGVDLDIQLFNPIFESLQLGNRDVFTEVVLNALIAIRWVGMERSPFDTLERDLRGASNLSECSQAWADFVIEASGRFCSLHLVEPIARDEYPVRANVQRLADGQERHDRGGLMFRLCPLSVCHAPSDRSMCSAHRIGDGRELKREFSYSDAAVPDADRGPRSFSRMTILNVEEASSNGQVTLLHPYLLMMGVFAPDAAISSGFEERQIINTTEGPMAAAQGVTTPNPDGSVKSRKDAWNRLVSAIGFYQARRLRNAGGALDGMEEATTCQFTLDMSNVTTGASGEIEILGPGGQDADPRLDDHSTDPLYCWTVFRRFDP